MTTDTTDAIQVTGTVKRTFGYKGGTGVALEVQNPKSRYPDEFTIWSELDVAQGDRITVRGQYSDKIDSYQAPSGPKTIIRRSLNDAILVARHDAAPAEASPPPADEPPYDPSYEPTWNTANIPGEDTPF